MKKIISVVMLVMVFFAIDGAALSAKETVKNEVVEFTLTPPPTCQNCVNKITNNLRFEKGVKDIKVDLENKSVTLTYSPSATNPENLAAALGKIGYEAVAVCEDECAPVEKACETSGGCCGQCCK